MRLCGRARPARPAHTATHRYHQNRSCRACGRCTRPGPDLPRRCIGSPCEPAYREARSNRPCGRARPCRSGVHPPWPRQASSARQGCTALPHPPARPPAAANGCAACGRESNAPFGAAVYPSYRFLLISPDQTGPTARHSTRCGPRWFHRPHSLPLYCGCPPR